MMSAPELCGTSCLALTSFGSANIGHTAPLRSAQMLGFTSHFVCPQPLYAMPCVDENIKNCKRGGIDA